MYIKCMIIAIALYIHFTKEESKRLDDARGAFDHLFEI